MVTHRLPDGGGVVLGDVVASAGEGVVYEIVDHPQWVAKVFRPNLRGLADKLDKVTAMTGSRPPGATQPDGFTVLTWPLHVLRDHDVAVGYVMARIETANSVEIHTLSNPSNRSDPLPTAPQWPRHATWQHLVGVAANLCVAVDAVHDANAVIGDFQERNILVADTTRVSLVDCDSMQFTAPSGRQFRCGVGRPEFTPPELADVNLREQSRSESSDLFALAVHVHLLLMGGNHPFLRGAWAGGGDQPQALSLAKGGHWAGGWQSLLRTHPLAPSPSFLPNDIQQLFSRALTSGAHDPAVRPAAKEWRAALLRIRTTSCARHIHDIPVGCFVCPWCSIADERERRSRQRPKVGPAVPQRQIINRVAVPPTPPAADVAQAASALGAGSTPLVGPTKRRPKVLLLPLAALLGLAMVGAGSALPVTDDLQMIKLPVESIPWSPPSNSLAPGLSADPARGFSAVGGADATGFIDHPDARCSTGDSTMMMGRTPDSVFVVCLGTGFMPYYYKTASLSEKSSTTLTQLTPVPGGFDATPSGRLVQIRNDAITITWYGARVSSDPVLEYRLP